MAYLSTTHEGVKLSIHVQARASRCALVGLHGDALKIALNVPPVDGKANEALRRFLAEVFRVSFAGVSIVSGAFSRNKIVLLAGCNEADALEVLAAAGLPASSKP